MRYTAHILVALLLATGCVHRWTEAPLDDVSSSTHATGQTVHRTLERVRVVRSDGDPLPLQPGQRIVEEDGRYFVPAYGVWLAALHLERSVYDYGLSMLSYVGWFLASAVGTIGIGMATVGLPGVLNDLAH